MKNNLARVTTLLALSAAAFGATSLLARPAEARLLDLHAGLQGGGLTGWGETANTPDFFQRRRGPGLGVAVGAKLLVFDVTASFFQLFDGGGPAGTLTQLLAGINIDIPVGNDKFQDGFERGKSRNIIRPVANVGFAAGTPEPIKDHQLNNAQISAKGFVSYAGVGYEHFLNEFFGVGFEGNFGYHYFIGGGRSDMLANQTHSSGYQLAGYATFTFHLGY
jgi:hypothetical protein